MPLNCLENKFYHWKYTKIRQNPSGENLCLHFRTECKCCISWKKNTEISMYGKMSFRTCIHESAIEALSFAQKIWFEFHSAWSSFYITTGFQSIDPCFSDTIHVFAILIWVLIIRSKFQRSNPGFVRFCDYWGVISAGKELKTLCYFPVPLCPH